MSFSTVLLYGILGIILIICIAIILIILWLLFCALIRFTFLEFDVFKDEIDERLNEVLKPCCFSDKKGGDK